MALSGLLAEKSVVNVSAAMAMHQALPQVDDTVPVDVRSEGRAAVSDVDALERGPRGLEATR